VVIGPDESGTDLPDYETLLAESAAVDPMADFPPQHPAFICYTSGTTGLPKGAVLSHRNVMGTALERMTCDQWNADDVGYIPYAIAFTGGLVAMWMPLYVAGSIVVLDATFDAERTLQVIAERKVTAFIAVGSVLMAMAASPTFETADLTSVTTLATGGSPIPVELIRQYERKGLSLAQQYGLTEGGGLDLILSAAEALTRIGSAGQPTPQCRARVVRPDGNDCDIDEVGELILRGPQCMEEYWEDPAATADTVVDGWVRTGDLAAVDKDGYFRIVDRMKDMLISGGLNIYPAEIERVLAEFEALEELAVIGVPHPRWGEVPVVVGRARGDTSEAEILDFCRERLGKYKVPKRAVLRAEPLPRGMSGKVLKRELREEYRALEVSG
jgi:fatty-acyl-CoA synthase